MNVETHEAAHAVVARALGVQVVRLVAAGDDPHCRTRWWRPRNDAEEIDAMERQALIVLAGEVKWSKRIRSRRARQTDATPWRIASAPPCRGWHRGRRRVRSAVCAGRIRVKAAALVEANMPAIARVTDALAERGRLDQADIKAILLEG
jgi:hypothetical protein